MYDCVIIGRFYLEWTERLFVEVGFQYTENIQFVGFLNHEIETSQSFDNFQSCSIDGLFSAIESKLTAIGLRKVQKKVGLMRSHFKSKLRPLTAHEVVVLSY